MRRGGHGRILQERDNAVPSGLHLESGRTVGTHVKIVALAAFSIAISILVWRLQPGRNLESRNPGFVFPLYQNIANGSHVGGGRGSRGGHGRRIRSDEYPTFELRLTQSDNIEFYIEMKVGHPLKPFYFQIDTASGTSWVHCGIPGYKSSIADFGRNGPFVSNKKSIVNCTGPTKKLCRALQYKKVCEAADDYECQFSQMYGDRSYYEGVAVNETLTMPIQDGTERSVFAVFGCVLNKKARAEALPLQTDGVAGLGKCRGNLVDQLATNKAIDHKVFGICLSKDVRAGQVGYMSLGMDFEDKFAQKKSVWVKLLVGQKRECEYYATLLFISIGNVRIKVKSLDPGNARGMKLGFDTGTNWTFLPKDVYDQVIDELKSFTSTGNYRSFRVRDDDDYLMRDQRMCWEYKDMKRKRDGLRPVKPPVGKFPTLKFEFEGIAGRGLQHLIVQPEKYLSWDDAESKLCVNFLADRVSPPHPLIGIEMMREHLFVFDTDNYRVRWTPNSC